MISSKNASQHFSIVISVLGLSVAICGLLFGNNIIVRILERTNKVEQVTQKLETTTKGLETTTQELETTTQELETTLYQILKSRENPTSISKPPSENSQCSYASYNLCPYNISFGDNKTDIQQVIERLKNRFSGYPALVEAIGRVIGNRKLIGNPVSLTIINAKNLEQHGLETENPIIDASNIGDEKLAVAIYKAWKEKNAPTANQLELQQILQSINPE